MILGAVCGGLASVHELSEKRRAGPTSRGLRGHRRIVRSRGVSFVQTIRQLRKGAGRSRVASRSVRTRARDVRNRTGVRSSRDSPRSSVESSRSRHGIHQLTGGRRQVRRRVGSIMMASCGSRCGDTDQQQRTSTCWKANRTGSSASDDRSAESRARDSKGSRRCIPKSSNERLDSSRASP